MEDGRYFNCDVCRNITNKKNSFPIDNFCDLLVCEQCRPKLSLKLGLKTYPNPYFFYCTENIHTKHIYVTKKLSKAKSYISEGGKYRCGVGVPRRMLYLTNDVDDKTWTNPDRVVKWFGESFDNFDPRLYVNPSDCTWECTLSFLEEELDSMDRKIRYLKERKKKCNAAKKELLLKQKEMLM